VHPAEVCVRLFLSFFPSCSSLRTRRHHLHALFCVQDCSGFKSCTSLLENVSLRVPTRHVRDFSNKHSPARRAYADNVVGKDLDIFAVKRFLFIKFYNLVFKLSIIVKDVVRNPYVHVLCSF
jgi:hypothetical protein